MKKTLTLLFVILTVFVFANPIDETTAKRVGANFLKTRAIANRQSLSPNSLTLAYKVSGKQILQSETKSITNYFYVFNILNSAGYVIVAGDDLAIPVLGYSTDRSFDTTNLPTNLLKWFEGYKNEIRFAIEKNITNTAENLSEWQKLLVTNNATGTSILGTPVVAPLIQTTWNQSPFYNALSPFDNQYNERTVTGCVATAMAQIMKYWNYPTTGTGFRSYRHSKYGNLSANFGATSYQWSSMPNNVTVANNAVATLMYHCGVSVDMNYGVAANNGSGAYVISAQSPIQHCSEYAFKTYFGYRNSLQGIQMKNYSITQWISILKNEFDANRPVLYAGFGQGGHCFVADGYDNNDFIHFNWGWGGGGPDGFYPVTAINPPALGTGGGNGGGFNSGQQAVIGIQPPATQPTYNLRLYTAVTPSNPTLNYGQPFSITTNIANYGTGAFSGDYCAAIFDNTNTFVGFVETKTNLTLNSNNYFTSNLVFSNTGMAAMMPGTYTVGIYYKPAGSTQWSLVANNGTFTNFPTITVIYNNNIALNSNITTAPSTLTYGQGASFNVNVKNVGSTTFTGKYYMAMYNLDGSFAQLIDSLNEATGLQVGFTYNSPFLNFSTSAITTNPGSYLLATLHKPSMGSLQLTGANSYQNPIKVIVKASDLTPDIYEVNNTVAQSSTLPIVFSGNNAYKNTIGSNLHLGNDYDFYKIALPAGFNYSIRPRLQDSYNSNNGNTYTVDALFAYSFDGTIWSDAFDDTLTSNITLNNGGTLYLIVAPYFSGNIGTYLLEMNLTRTAITPIVLNRFDADLKNNIVELIWATSSEINCNYYDIERSENLREFYKLGQVKAVGNSTTLKDYKFIDNKPLNGINYYRLKQVDNDGKYTYSNVKKVEVQNNQQFKVYPNPANDFIFIEENNITEIRIIDKVGKVIYQKQNINAPIHSIKVNSFQKGIHIIQITTKKGYVKIEKILIN